MGYRVGDFNMWTGKYVTQEDVDRSNAFFTQLAASNPDLDLDLDTLSEELAIGPSAEAEAAQTAVIAQQEAAAAAQAQAQAEAEAAQAAAQAEADRLAAEAVAAQQAADEALAASQAAMAEAIANSTGVGPVYTSVTQAAEEQADAAQATAVAVAEAAAQADAIANPPYDTNIYEKSDGYWYYRDEDGNEIDIGTRDEDRAAEMLDKYEEVVNEDLTPLTDTSAYVGEDGEPKEGYRFVEDGTVFQDIGDTWAQIYVNEDGENVAKDTGREKFKHAVDWEKGAEGERNEGLGGALS